MSSVFYMVMLNLSTSTFHIYVGDCNDPSTWRQVDKTFTDLSLAEARARELNEELDAAERGVYT